MGLFSQISGKPRQIAERWRVHFIVATLALGWAVLYLDRSILFPLIPVIGDDLNLTDTQRGAISSVYFITCVIVQIPSGVLGDRRGLKNVLTGMCLIIGLGLLGIGVFSVSYLLLLLFIAIQGFGAGAFYSGSYGITISSVPPERRGTSSAIVTSGMALGSTLAILAVFALYGFFGGLAWNPIIVAWVGDHTFASGRVSMGTVMGVGHPGRAHTWRDDNWCCGAFESEDLA